MDHKPSAELEDRIATSMIIELFNQSRQAQGHAQRFLDAMSIEQLDAIRAAKVEAAKPKAEVKLQ